MDWLFVATKFVVVSLAAYGALALLHVYAGWPASMEKLWIACVSAGIAVLAAGRTRNSKETDD